MTLDTTNIHNQSSLYHSTFHLFTQLKDFSQKFRAEKTHGIFIHNNDNNNAIVKFQIVVTFYSRSTNTLRPSKCSNKSNFSYGICPIRLIGYSLFLLKVTILPYIILGRNLWADVWMVHRDYLIIAFNLLNWCHTAPSPFIRRSTLTAFMNMSRTPKLIR